MKLQRPTDLELFPSTDRPEYQGSRLRRTGNRSPPAESYILLGSSKLSMFPTWISEMSEPMRLRAMVQAIAGVRLPSPTSGVGQDGIPSFRKPGKGTTLESSFLPPGRPLIGKAPTAPTIQRRIFGGTYIRPVRGTISRVLNTLGYKQLLNPLSLPVNYHHHQFESLALKPWLLFCSGRVHIKRYSGLRRQGHKL